MAMVSAGDLRLMALATLNEELARRTARSGVPRPDLSSSAFLQQLQQIESAIRKRLARAGQLRTRTAAPDLV